MSVTSTAREVLAAGTASAIGTVVANPFEVAKTRLQLQHGLALKASSSCSFKSSSSNSSVRTPKYRGSIHAIFTILKEEGIRGAYSGFTGFALYRTAMNAAKIGLFYPLKGYLVNSSNSPLYNSSQPLLVDMTAATLTGGPNATLYRIELTE